MPETEAFPLLVWKPYKGNNLLRVTNVQEKYILCLAYAEDNCHQADMAIFKIESQATEFSPDLLFKSAVGKDNTHRLADALPFVVGTIEKDGKAEFEYKEKVKVESHKDLVLLHATIEAARRIAMTELFAGSDARGLDEDRSKAFRETFFKGFRGFAPSIS